MSVGIRIALLGYGRVGQAVAALAIDDREPPAAVGGAIAPVIALVRNAHKLRSGPAIPVSERLDDVLAAHPDVVVDVLDGALPAAEAVRRALEAGIPVVSANKTLLAECGPALLDLSRARGVPFRYEAAVAAGVPFLGALSSRPRLARPRRLVGILNGTSHFLCDALNDGLPLAEAFALAVRRGYAEPDGTADLSGLDAARKLTILARLAGCPEVSMDDLTRVGLDAVTSLDVAAARALGGSIKPVAMASFVPATAGAWVGPALMDAAHPAAVGRGVFNFVELTSDDDDEPVLFAGPGAGPRVTAAAILDDVVEVARGGGSRACCWRSPARLPAPALRTPPASSWYLRIAGLDGATIEHVGEMLAAHRLTPTRLVGIGRTIAARTRPAGWREAAGARDVFAAAGAEVRLFPVVEAWHG